MKLSHVDFETVFQLDGVNVLVVESERAFTRYCQELKDAIENDEGNFCLTDGERVAKMGKRCVLVSDLLSLEIESKKVVNRLFLDLKGLSESQFAERWYRLKGEICEFLAALNGNCLLPIEYDEENDVTSILKAFNVRLLQEDASLVEQLVSFLKTARHYLGVECFFFVNLKCFLEEDELQMLYEEAALEQTGLFLLENSERKPLHTEKIVLLDRDLCEIVVKDGET